MTSYVILWLSRVTCSLLFVATIVALAARCKKPFWRRFWPILFALLVFLHLAYITCVGFYLLKTNPQPKWLFWYGLSETIAFIIGVIITLRQGLKGAASEGQGGRTWPRAHLAVAFGIALFVFIVTLNFAETSNMIYLSNVRAWATRKLISSLPAHLPNALNAYPVYNKAAHALGPREDIPEWVYKSEKPDFDPTSPDVRALLLKHDSVLATVRRAVSIPGYSFTVDVENYSDSPLPEFWYYPVFARLLSLSARSKTKDGDLIGALDELRIIENMAEHLRSFPLLLPSMVAILLDQIRYRTLESVLALQPDLPVDLIKLPIDIPPPIQESYFESVYVNQLSLLQGLTETLSSSDFFAGTTLESEAKKSEPIPDYRNPTLPTKFWRVFFLPSEVRVEKDIMLQWLSKPAKSYEEFKANTRAIDNAYTSGEMGILSGIAPPSYSGYTVQAMKCDSQRGLCAMALAATAYKAVNGQYPKKGEDLVPKYMHRLPVDQFNRKPLKMKTLREGLDLYSVGPKKQQITPDLQNLFIFI